jgi:hypothetical protein
MIEMLPLLCRYNQQSIFYIWRLLSVLSGVVVLKFMNDIYK